MKLIVISDLHLGKKDKAEDFHADAALYFFLWRHRKDIIVLNGDIVDMWQLEHPFLAYEAHQKVYGAIKSWVNYWVRGNHDGELKELCRQVPLQPVEAVVIDGIIVMHGHQFDRWNSGPLLWVGKAATRVAGWLERVIHRDADVWLARQGRKLAGHGRYGDSYHYSEAAMEFLLEHPGYRGLVLGHTHQFESPKHFPVLGRPGRDRVLANTGHWTGPDAGTRCDYVEIEVADDATIEVLTEV
jgi:UDP-2,3-diacylglucosamine pyrophosphatase LpxH